jgi:hypothetical protein
MYAQIVFIACCLLIPIYCCSEPSPVLELPEIDNTNSATSRPDIRGTRTQADEHGLQKCAVSASDHGSQHQHHSNERSSTTINIETGMTHYPDDAPFRFKHNALLMIPTALVKQGLLSTG